MTCVRTGKLRDSGKKTLTHIIINRTGLAEMRGPVLWLQHTSSTPDTSTRRPVCPQCFRAHLHPVVSIKLKQRQPWPCKIFLWLCRYYQLKLCTNRRGQQCLEFLTSVLAVECTRMQQLPTMLGPAVHRGKDTTQKTLKTMCNLRAWPQQLMLEEVCKRIQHCCATLRRSHTQKKKCWELLAQKFVGQQVCVRLNAEQGMAQCWERSPPTNVARVQIPTSMP